MMHPLWKSFKQIVSTVFGLALLALLAWATYWVLRSIVLSISRVDTQVLVAALAPSIAAVASVITLTVSRHLDRKRAVEAHLRSKRTPVYEDFVDFWFRLMSASSKRDKAVSGSDEEMVDFLRKFTQKALLWASDDVLARYAAFRRSTMTSALTDQLDTSALFVFEDLLFAFRRDLGYSNKGLKRGDLLAQFILDIDNYLPQGTRRAKAGDGTVHGRPFVHRPKADRL